MWWTLQKAGKQMSTRRGHSRFVAAVVATLFAGGLVQSLAVDIGNAAPAPKSPIGAIVKGEAYGALASLSATGSMPSVSEGKVAWQVMPCVARNGVTFTNQGQISALNKPSVLSAVPGLPTNFLGSGTVVDTGVASFNASQADVTESSTVQSASLFDGQIAATGLKALAHTSLTGAGTASDGAMTFASLTIGTQTFSNSPAPNTVVALPLLPGVSVVLNEQIPSLTGITVSAIHVIVTNLGGYHGDIYVATASTMAKPSTAALQGYAFMASASAPPVVVVGRQNVNYLPCAGTNGVPNSQSTPSVVMSSVALSGTGTSTVEGQRGTTSYSKSRSQIQNLNIGNGMVTASVITAAANTAGSSGALTSDFTGVQFVNLTVNGNPVPVPVSGTNMSLPGVGTITFNVQLCKSDNAAAPRSCNGAHYSEAINTAIVIDVTVPNNPLGLPTGVQIRIAEAETAVRV